MALQIQQVDPSTLSPCISTFVRCGDNSATGTVTEYSFTGGAGGNYRWGVDDTGFLNSGWVAFQLTIGAGGGPDSSLLSVGSADPVAYGAMTYSQILSIAIQACGADNTCIMKWKELSVSFYTAGGAVLDDPSVPAGDWPSIPAQGLSLTYQISPGNATPRVRVVITGSVWLQSTASATPARNSIMSKIFIMTDTCDPY